MGTELTNLNNHSKQVHKENLTLPDSLPKRIYTLANDITKNSDNNYDKLKSIENFLSSNYSYTLVPDEIPENSDFVDHFLFSSKSGYCTYFATSMAILSRCIGIPTRYVEGYSYPFAAHTMKTYTVTNMEAHAWVEAYLEGFGWIPFEPTTCFTGSFYDAKSAGGLFNPDFLKEYENSNYLKNLQKYNTDLRSSKNSEINTNNSNKPFKLIVSVILGIVLLVIIVIIINIFRLRNNSLQLLKLDNRNSVLENYKYYLKVFELAGNTMNTSETAYQFADRIDKTITFENYSFKDITKIFVISRYSNINIDDSSKIKFSEFRVEMLKYTRKQMNFIT
jgi:hypothetical protein